MIGGLMSAPENDALGPHELADAVVNFETPLGDYLGAQLREGFWSSIPGQLQAEMRLQDPEQIRAGMLREFEALGMPQSTAQPEALLDEQAWKASPWYREKLPWDPRMTETRAKALADIYDENAYRRWLIDRSPEGARSVAGFGAAVLGGGADPVNFIPIFGPAARAAAAARFARVMGPNAARIAAPAAVQAGEAAIGTALAQPFLIESRAQFGDDVGFADAMLDIAFSAVFGAAVGGGTGAWRAFRDRGAALPPQAQQLAADALNQAVADVAAGRAVNIRLVSDEVDAVRAELQQELSLLPRDEQQSGDRRQPMGDAGEVAITPQGRRVPVQYEIVELADLVASHGDDLQANPAFPAELQPRERARAASAAQIADLAGRLDPELLGRTAAAGDGAPIVGPDNVVESGNGRTLALRRAYAQNLPGAQRYREWLASQGFDVAGKAQPVLVRRRQGAMAAADRAAFAREANERSTLAMGLAERARSDAANLPDRALDLFEGGDLDAQANQAFVRSFLETVAPAERGALITGDGRLSQDGLRRLQAGLLAKAYDDPHLVAGLMESTDDNLKGIGQALLAASPDWIRLRAAVRAGEVTPDMDQTGALLQAIALVRQARDKRIKLRDLADQLDMFDPGNATVRQFLQLIYGEDLARQVSARQLGIALARFADQAMLNLAGPRLFGDALSAGDVLDTVLRGSDGGRLRLVDTAAPEPEIPPAPAKAAPGTEAQAKEMGIELGGSAAAARFDEDLALQQIEAAGRLREDEAAAIAAAADLAKRADNYAGGFEAAAACLARRAA